MAVRADRCVPITLLSTEIDTGVVQIDSLRLDEQATIERAATFYADLPAARQREARSASRA